MRLAVYASATFVAGIGIIFLLLLLPSSRLANITAAVAVGGFFFGAAAIFVLMDLRMSIVSVVVSDYGVEYRYPIRKVRVPWAGIRPPTGRLGRFWSPNDRIVFTDMVPKSLVPLAIRPVTPAQARAIVDFPSSRPWSLEEKWSRAIHSPPQSVRQWWRSAPVLVKGGLVGVILGFGLVAAAVAVVALGIVPSCAFSDSSCPTPDWFNATFYIILAGLLGGLIALEIGRFSQRNPLDDESTG